MKNYEFIDNFGTFKLNSPEKYSGLYFPIASPNGMKSCITPLLAGDAKTDQNTFLLQPVSIRDIADNRSSRNFWLYIDGYGSWSATGNSARQEADRFSENPTDKIELTAGLLWHKLTNTNKTAGVKSEIVSFCPITDDSVEVHKFTFTNISDSDLNFKPYTAVPLYCRSADNIRDHRHVTSLLHRVCIKENGIEINPTLTFDERGHKLNTVKYGTFAICCDGTAPVGFMPSTAEFIGEGGTLLNPRSIGRNFPYKKGYTLNGEECIAVMQFNDVTLTSQESISYIVVLSVDKNGDFDPQKYLSESAFDSLLENTKKYWLKNSLSHIHTGDNGFDSWVKWVSVQPLLRRIYGCSFLPHHDYGRGGRGWRDLWQDCLALLLSNPDDVKDLLINNFAGVRIDGTNATIIGEKAGEFIADRNNITRVWMDHGAWATVTTKLYIDQTGDIDILLKEQTYFKDIQTSRAKLKDAGWNDSMGNLQKTSDGSVYKGSILEHLILPTLSVFFNVGEHNIMRLEGADWNDGLDMAAEHGESVAFSCLYYKNLLDIADFVLKLKEKNRDIYLSRELLFLLDYNNGADYDSIKYKTDILNKYFSAIVHTVSGEKVKIDPNMLIADLTAKANHIKNLINNNEIISTESGKWFNSYYDNSKRQTDGFINGQDRMMLTGQVFAIMGGIADDDMIKNITKAADKLLYCEEIGGYRLNTDFEEIKTDLGRLFGFAYGHKENGAVFSHMAVMYGNALYSRKFAKEGYKALKALYNASKNIEKSHIYPAIPEYFDPNGNGLYNYLTGSASWLMMTVICEMFGIKGKNGMLTLEPKLTAEQFDENCKASIEVNFYGLPIMICYQNKNLLEPDCYSVKSINVNGENTNGHITKEKLKKFDGKCTITVELG